MSGAKKAKKKKVSNCPHVTQTHSSLSWSLINAKQESLCHQCSHMSQEIWLCTVCLSCYGNHGDGSLDHSFTHVKQHKHHLAVNPKSSRFWCYCCNGEVYAGADNTPEFRIPKEAVLPADWGALTGHTVLDDPHNPRGLTGLRNMGNTCYMNGALQCLSNCLAMSVYFLTLVQYDMPDPRKARLASAYTNLVKDLWASKNPGVVIPLDFLKAIQIVNRSFQGYMQQDTQELLRCLIDQLHEELKRELTYDPPYHMSSDPDNPEQRSVKYGSVIADIFNGLIKSSVRCLHCEKVSVTKEAFQDLSLPIPCGDQLARLHNNKTEVVGQSTALTTDSNQGYISWLFSPLVYLWSLTSKWSMLSYETVTLDDCLSALFSVDDLTGDNMYSCENCKKLRNGKKEVSIVSLPEVMCIHLKRFRHDVMHSSKITTYVTFPIDGLDISPYMKKDKPTDGACTLYNLTGVICHLGSFAGGHYKSYTRHPANQKWYEYDDSSVFEVSVQTVVNCEAYVLFYTRDGSAQDGFREQFLAQLQIPKAPSLLQFYVSKVWLFKLFNCSNPGPISNQADFLCVHGAIRPSECSMIHERVVALSAESWHTIHQRYGGGPAVSSLTKCSICQANIEENKARQMFEQKTYLIKENMATNHYYAISTGWVTKWERYVMGHISTPPGPIDNKSIVTDKSVTTRKSKQTKSYNLRRGADYINVSGAIWRFLRDTYGGGPQAISHYGPDAESEEESVAPEPTVSRCTQPEEETEPKSSSLTSSQSDLNIATTQSESSIPSVVQQKEKVPLNSQSAPQLASNDSQLDCDVEKGATTTH